MKIKVPVLFATMLVAVASLPAANIAWVSFHPGDNEPSASALALGFTRAPDAGYTALLAANGHAVTRFLTVADVQNNPTLIADLNTYDLVIISRSVDSAHYDTDPERAAWNGLTVPMMTMGGYVNRANRLGFHTGDTINDNSTDGMRLKVNAPGHPIFAGISLDASNNMVNPYSSRVTFTNAGSGATALQNGISAISNPLITGGNVLATVGTPTDSVFGRTIIAEFPADINDYHTNRLAAKRMIFLSGSREAAPITSQGAGIFDLFPDGQAMFLNAVTYLTTVQPPKCLLALVGATNLVAGDAWTFNAAPTGESPLSYQWYWDGNPMTDATNATLTLASLTPAEAGAYYLIVANLIGQATSTVARLDFAIAPPANLTNSLISYWPLDAVVGAKTPDLVSAYDMTLNKMGATNIVAGRWGNAFEFNNAWQSSLERVNNPGEALPIYQHPNFTVSLWVNAMPQAVADHRVFCEANTAANNPMFSLGTHNSSTTDGTVDLYIRNDTGAVVGDHRHSTAIAYNGQWHNVVYAQRDVGNGNMKAQLWIDGNLDAVAITPVRPLTPNTTAIGALLRASPAAWFTGLIDEVAVWNRALSSEEIQILQGTSITNPPSRTQPLAINSFKADLPAVAMGSSNLLRWDVTKDASLVTINPLGDVTAQTSVGLGASLVTLTQAATYVLTIQRGTESLSATTRVAVVDGVAAGWNLLDNFDQYPSGGLATNGYWNDPGATSVQVTNLGNNPAVRTATGNSIGYLYLRGLSLAEGQARTLFFRIIPGASNAAGITNIIGLTDKSQRNYDDEFQNIGPVLYPTPFTNNAAGITTNAWYLGARNGYGTANDNVSSPIDYPAPPATTIIPLEPRTVYNVWIDITNAPLGLSASDGFTVYVQKEGVPGRTLLFQDYASDRDPTYVDQVLGGATPVLDKLVIMGNNANNSAYFDDFYLSASGYSATVPRPYGFTGPLPPTVGIGWSGAQLRIQWNRGILQQASSLSGPWSDVSGNPVSPYPVTPAGGTLFFRTR